MAGNKLVPLIDAVIAKMEGLANHRHNAFRSRDLRRICKSRDRSSR
jgi:hypothetical protein